MMERVDRGKYILPLFLVVNVGTPICGIRPEAVTVKRATEPSLRMIVIMLMLSTDGDTNHSHGNVVIDSVAPGLSKPVRF